MHSVLVIDDEASVQEIVCAYLEKRGCTVYVSGTGRDGLAVAKRIRPGLIVLDLSLPDVSGEEICREIRSRSDVPIVMLNAKAAEEERTELRPPSISRPSRRRSRSIRLSSRWAS